jgi:hypothetical protein
MRMLLNRVDWCTSSIIAVAISSRFTVLLLVACAALDFTDQQNKSLGPTPEVLHMSLHSR